MVYLIVSRREVKPLGVYDWGQYPPNQAMRDLAKRMVLELTKDTARTEKVYQRFMYHVLGTVTKEQDWKREEEYLRKVLDLVEADDTANAHMRALVMREMPRGGGVASPTASQIPGKSAGYGGNDSAPDRRRG
jgi:hypothetical protein